MLKCSLVILLFLACTNLFGAGTVRLSAPAGPLVEAVETAPVLTLVVDAPSGDGTSEAAPAKVYVPIDSLGSPNNTLFSSYSNGLANILPSITSGTLNFYLDLVPDSEFFEIAVKRDSTTFVVLKSSAITTTFIAGSAFKVSVGISEICAKASSQLNCSAQFASGNNPVATAQSFLYFFYSSTDLAESSTITTTNGTGIFYEFNVSNKVDNSSTITLNSLLKGDSQLTAVYTGFAFIPLHQVIAFDYGTTQAADLTYSAAKTLGGIEFILDDFATSGESKIKGLTNDRSYFFSIFFFDKYKFATKFSNVLSGTPQQIETLLEKNACFLLTAGFGGDHPVIDYFRSWRDEFLLSFSLGRLFVDFYYDWGPKIAPYILENPYLAKVVRGGAYAAYWTLEFKLWGVLLFFIVALVFLKRRNRLN